MAEKKPSQDIIDLLENANAHVEDYGKTAVPSGLDKLTSKIVINRFKNWGEVQAYALAQYVAQGGKKSDGVYIGTKAYKAEQKKKEEEEKANKPLTEYEQSLVNMGAAWAARREYEASQGPSNYQLGVGIHQAQQVMAGSEPGSPEYKKAKASYDALLAGLASNAETAKIAADKEAAKKAVEKRKGLVEALTRAQDYGTPQQVKDAQAALNAFDKKAAAGQQTGKVPKDSKGNFSLNADGEFLKDGKPYTGDYVMDAGNGKKKVWTVKNGIVPSGQYRIVNPDGTFKTYDMSTDKEVKTGGSTTTPSTSASTTTPSTSTPSGKSTPGSTTTPSTSSSTQTPSGSYTPPAGGTTNDGKTIWVSALKQTFKTGIDDPKQKAEIDNLIATAKKNSWSEKTFMEALKGTKWWAATLPTLRQFFLDTHDPRNAATFAQTLSNKMDSVTAAMEKLGVKINDIDPVTGKVVDNTSIIKDVASLALQNGWDDNQIQEHLATKSEVIFTGGGLIGSYLESIKKQALLYGVSLDANEIAGINRDLLNPQDGKDAQWYMNNMKQKAIDANPAFAASLKEGRSLYDVTSSYRNQMAALLEVDPTNITWNDLMNKVMNKDKGTVNTFSDFTKAVKQDPLWQTTKNAKETYSNMANDLLKQFGFLG